MLITDLRSIVFKGEDILRVEEVSENYPASLGLIFEKNTCVSLSDAKYDTVGDRHWPVLVREGNGNTFEGKLLITRNYDLYELKVTDVYSKPEREVIIIVTGQIFRRFIKRLID